MRKFLLFISLALLSLSCDKNNSQIPYVAFDFTVNINEPQLFNLLTVGGHETVTGGSLGLILYRKSFSEFVALDRHSPYEVDKECQVDVLSDGIVIEDPCSGSQWVITDGTLIEGPASVSLTSYTTIFNDPYLRVYN